MKNRIKWLKLIACVAIPLATGGLSALLTAKGMAAFETVAKPPLSPPAWLFPVVWTMLFILMGISSYLVSEAEVANVRKERALTVYGVQLAANFMWSIIFFTMRLYLPAFIWLVLLLGLIGLTMFMFSYICKAAAKALIPYFLWVCFAGYLNFGIFLLN